MRKLVKLPSVENVVAGSTFSLTMPLGLTYNQIMLTITGVTLAQLTNIQVRINGKAVQEFASGTVLNDLNLYHGREGFENTVCPIYFSRPELNPSDRDICAIGTADISTFTIVGDIDAGAAAPVIKARAQQSAPRNLGIITKIRRFPKSFATSGEQEVATLPRFGAIACIHLKKGDVNDCLLKIDNNIVWELTAVEADQFLESKGKTPVTASYYVLDFIPDGWLFDAIKTTDEKTGRPVIQDFSVRPTLTTSGAVDIIIEYLANFNQG